MIFTLGHTESYERYFREQGTPKKLGRNKSYEGGTVWETQAEAQKYVNICCPDGYSVYGVEADWDKDTIIDIILYADKTRSLKRTSKLVKVKQEIEAVEEL